MKQQVRDTHIYFPVKVLEQVKKLAEKNRRTMTAEVVIAVERHLEAARNGEKK